MCGRYALGLSHEQVQSLGSRVQVRAWNRRERFRPRHNIAPNSEAPIICRRHPTNDSSDASDIIIETAKWGLVPHWSTHDDRSLNTINARSENLETSGGMWASIKGKKRCAVICQGYYEWLKKGKERIPYFTKHKGEQIMLLAGLYDIAHFEGTEEPFISFTIVTTTASSQLSWLHDRQPVILTSKAECDTWLDTTSQTWDDKLANLIKPYDQKAGPVEEGMKLQWYQVPQEVGRVNAESSSFIIPVKERKDGIQAMLAKQPSKKASNEGNLRIKDSEEENKISISASPPSSSPIGKAKRERSESPTMLLSSAQTLPSKDSKKPEPSSQGYRPKRLKVEPCEHPSPDRGNDQEDKETKNSVHPEIIDVDALEIPPSSSQTNPLPKAKMSSPSLPMSSKIKSKTGANNLSSSRTNSPKKSDASKNKNPKITQFFGRAQ